MIQYKVENKDYHWSWIIEASNPVDAAEKSVLAMHPRHPCLYDEFRIKVTDLNSLADFTVMVQYQIKPEVTGQLLLPW